MGTEVGGGHGDLDERVGPAIEMGVRDEQQVAHDDRERLVVSQLDRSRRLAGQKPHQHIGDAAKHQVRGLADTERQDEVDTN